MKKLILGLAALSLLIGASSCQKEIIESVNDGKGISFKTVLGKPATKVSEFKYWEEEENKNKINVYSYYGGVTTPFNEFELTYSSGDWTYGGSINQPGVPIRYYSVYPEPADVAIGDEDIAESGGQWLDVTTDDKPFIYIVKTSGDKSDQQNIIADAQEDLVAATYTGLNEEVTLQFKHLLSQVNFAVQGMLGVEIKVSDIKLNGITNNGVYKFSANSNAGGWSAATTSTTDNYNYLPLTGTNTPADTLALGISQKVIYLGNAPYNSYNKNNALMLMPQSFASDATTKPTLTFGFSLRPDSNGDGVINSSDNAAKTGSVTVDLCDFETTTWLSGKRYVYLIDFTSYLAGGPITFVVEVDDWKNYDEVDDDNKGTGIVETLHVPNASQGSIEAAIAMHSAANEAKSALKIFPISVATRPTAEAPITLTKIIGFDKANTDTETPADIINIEFPAKGGSDPDLEDVFFCAVPGWTMSITGRVATLTCGTPNAAADYAGTVTAEATLEDLMYAIHTQSVANEAKTGLKYFPVTFNGTFTDNTQIPAIINFDVDDKIFITCKNKATAEKIVTGISGWSGSKVENVVILTCNSTYTNAIIAPSVTAGSAGTLVTTENLINAFANHNTNNGLKVVFPIVIADKFQDDEVNIPIIMGNNFKINKRIYIICKDEDDAKKISCTASNFDVLQTGNIVILSSLGETASPVTVTEENVTLANLLTAISSQHTAKGYDAFSATVFPIIIENSFDGDEIIIPSGSYGNFNMGDVIYISCKDSVEADKVSSTVSGLTFAKSGNVVTLTKN